MPRTRGLVSMRPVWFAAIAVGAAFLGAGGWWVTSRVLFPLEPAALRAVTVGDVAGARAKVEETLADAKEYAAFFKLLRETFPADYAVDLDRFAARAAASGQQETIDSYFTDAYRALRQTRGIVAAKAAPPLLTRVFDADAALLKSLGSADPHLCVDFIYGGATQAYFDFAAAHREMVAELGNAALAAIIDGQTRKMDREPPGDADFQSLEKALSGKGLNKTEIAVLIDAKAPDPPIPDARMCTIEQTNLAVLKSLPEAQRWRIYRLRVELMART